MKLETIAAAALLSLSVSASANTPDFRNLPDLGDALAGFQTQAARQQAAAPAAISALKGPVPDVGAYAVRGADISHYQGVIDWTKVPEAGLSFVYMKATEGTDMVDEKFAENWQGAESAGLARGAYQFYDFCEGGLKQAQLFVKTVPSVPDALPPVVDLEESGSCKKMPGKTAFLKQFALLSKTLEKAYGKKPILYMPYGIYDAYFKGDAGGYKFWIVDQKAAPQLPDGTPWTIWQYDWYGAVAGMPGQVDLDVFNGTPQMLAALEGSSDGIMVADLRY